ncbi:transposase domain-containing protein [Bacillus sp. Bva_UNVM-123]|uniref:transposase domain-containing protein n=1 Tax=Bacillus sp. Bva_UNVM-123 TaxID=2829798 RepID=UPI00391F46DA
MGAFFWLVGKFKIIEEQLAHSNQQNKKLLKQVEALTEQVRHLTKKLFGSKTEKTKYNVPDGQGSLFEDDPSFNESEHTEEQSHRLYLILLFELFKRKSEMILYELISKGSISLSSEKYTM